MSGDDYRPPSDEELAAAQRSLEDRLAPSGVELGDPALWEPSPDLEAALLAAAVPDIRRPRPAWRMVAAVVVAVAALGAVAVAALQPTEPDWSVTLAATDLAPDATGVIDGWNEASGTRVVLTIDNLAPAPDGYFYELWFSEGPIHISAGTFRATANVELRAAVARADFPRLWITLEPIDEDEAPSGMTVLDTG